MSWETLFEDLQSQYDAAVRADADDVTAELTEAEAGTTRLGDRLRARVGHEVSLRLRTGLDVRGTLLDAAPQWVLVGADERRTLVPVAAVHLAWPLGPVAPEAGIVEQRLRITHVLRALAREGSRVRVTCDGGAYAGRLTRVGADHLDLSGDGAQEGPDLITVALASVLAVATA